MTAPMRLPVTAIAIAAALALAPCASATAQSFSAPQRAEIESIVKEYLVSHPEILQDVMAELEKRQAAAESEKARAAVATYAETLFHSARHVVVGNPKGDVTLVEFFDYNCGFCKRALSDLTDLMRSDAKLRVVLKEFPVLGEGSVEAARIAVAVRMQDKGNKYFEFHQKLLTGRGQADRARALAVAKEVGFDMARIEKDAASEEVKLTLAENFKVAEALGLNGTPSYVIGKEVVVGAVGRDALMQKVKASRCAEAGC